MNKYEQFVEKIITELGNGNAVWRKTWRSGGARNMPRNGTTGNPYRGMNALTTSCAGFKDPRWFTYKQAQDAGGNVKAGESGTPVVFWSQYKKVNQKTGEE